MADKMAEMSFGNFRYEVGGETDDKSLCDTVAYDKRRLRYYRDTIEITNRRQSTWLIHYHAIYVTSLLRTLVKMSEQRN